MIKINKPLCWYISDVITNMNLGCVSWLEISIYSLFIITVCMKIIWHNRMVSFPLIIISLCTIMALGLCMIGTESRVSCPHHTQKHKVVRVNLFFMNLHYILIYFFTVLELFGTFQSITPTRATLRAGILHRNGLSPIKFTLWIYVT